MKKRISFLVVLVWILSLSACVVSTGDGIQTPSNVEVGDSGVSGTDGNRETTEESGNDQPSYAEATIESVVLLDESGVKITAKSLNMDGIFGPEIKLLIENNAGKDLTVQCRNASVNGYMVDTMMSVDVANGKKANDDLTIMRSDLEICGITDIADLEFSFHIFTTDDYETYLDTEQIQIKTSIADSYSYVFDDHGDMVYDADGIKIVVKGLSGDDSVWGPSLVVYMENRTEKAFTVQCRNVSVNGFMVETIFSCDVMPGKRAVDTITFMNSDLEENEITAIENTELSFHVFDSESWQTIVDTEVVKITF